MKAPNETTAYTEQSSKNEFRSPSFQDIIKYEQLGKKLQADAFHSVYKTTKAYFIRLIPLKKP